jgi:hypothetical protein
MLLLSLEAKPVIFLKIGVSRGKITRGDVKKMQTKMDQETQRAWQGWVFFTRFVGWSIVAIAVVVAAVVKILTI